MAFLEGNTLTERRNHLQALIRSRKLESIQKNLMSEIDRVLKEILQMQQRGEQQELQLGQITSQLGSPQFQSQWPLLEQRKLQIEADIEDITSRQIKEAEELLGDLQTLRGAVREEKKSDRKVS